MGEIVQDRIARFVELIAPGRSAATMDELSQRVAEGETLDAVCQEWAVPYGRVSAWLAADPMRMSTYESALRLWADRLATETVALADDGGGDVQHARLRVDTRMKLVSKLDRTRFGERLDVTVAVVDVRGALEEARARVGKRDPVLIEQVEGGGDI